MIFISRMYINRILHLFGIPQAGLLVILIFGMYNFTIFISRMHIDRILHPFGIPQAGSLVILIYGLCNFSNLSSIMRPFNFNGVFWAHPFWAASLLLQPSAFTFRSMLSLIICLTCCLITANNKGSSLLSLTWMPSFLDNSSKSWNEKSLPMSKKCTPSRWQVLSIIVSYLQQ